ncbi:hypothetical protein NXV99_02620 [Bacteroides fragilis]|nr:hypothetical protein [Bacteroides fragilis]
MKNTIPIFFAINEEYIDHCCTSIVSILENNRYLNISIYILTDYISLESKEFLQEIKKCIYLCNYPMGNNRFRIIQATQEKKEDTSPNTLFIVMPSQIFFPIWIKPYTWMQI